MGRAGPKKDPTSKKTKKEIKSMYAEGYEIAIKTFQMINESMKKGNLPSDEMLRFIKRGPEIIAAYEKHLTKEKEKEEVLPEGKLKEFVENYYKIHKVLQTANYPTGKQGVIKALEDASYYICDLCGYSHKISEECPILLLAKEFKVNLQENSN